MIILRDDLTYVTFHKVKLCTKSLLWLRIFPSWMRHNLWCNNRIGHYMFKNRSKISCQYISGFNSLYGSKTTLFIVSVSILDSSERLPFRVKGTLSPLETSHYTRHCNFFPYTQNEHNSMVGMWYYWLLLLLLLPLRLKITCNGRPWGNFIDKFWNPKFWNPKKDFLSWY